MGLIEERGMVLEMLQAGKITAADAVGLLEALVAGLPVVVTDTCGYAHHIDSGRAGIVLPAPFEQMQLDQALLRMLDGVYRAECRRSALVYAELTDLYSMHETGARLIEEFVSSRMERSDG